MARKEEFMDVICAWCGKKLGEEGRQGVDGKATGICDDCLNRYFPHHADKIKELLEVERMEDYYQGHNKGMAW